jgi:hypothetical protein
MGNIALQVPKSGATMPFKIVVPTRGLMLVDKKFSLV